MWPFAAHEPETSRNSYRQVINERKIFLETCVSCGALRLFLVTRDTEFVSTTTQVISLVLE